MSRIDTLLVDNREAKKLIKRQQKLITDLLNHLDWIGWGDPWERECSADLRKEAKEYEEEVLK